MARLPCIGLLCIVAAISAAFWWESQDDDKAEVGPNIDRAEPSVEKAEFVGATACAECHSDVADRYRNSGHANTFRLSMHSDVAKALSGQDFTDPIRKDAFHYNFDDAGLSVTLPTRFGGDHFPLTYALGSGMHAVTFLSLVPHQNGGAVGIEHRVSAYDCDEELNLDITIGQRALPEPQQEIEHFGKLVTGKDLVRCIECHTTTGHIQDFKVANLIPHVGCESCHGAGSRHVSAMNEGDEQPSFDTKQKWQTAHDELQTCGSCHRLPESLSKTKLKRESLGLVRFQPAGLMQSLCYKNSAGAMRCTTCHDPHSRASKDAKAYEKKCLECHADTSSAQCSVQDDNCLQCHMPAIKLDAVTLHDHWIRVRNDADPVPVPLQNGVNTHPHEAVNLEPKE